jgi:hypothetical protein
MNWLHSLRGLVMLSASALAAQLIVRQAGRLDYFGIMHFTYPA